MPSKIKEGEYFKLSSSIPEREIRRYNLARLLKVPVCYIAGEVLRDYYTDWDVSFTYLNRRYIVPQAFIDVVSQSEFEKSKWFAQRALDIEEHPRTTIFK